MDAMDSMDYSHISWVVLLVRATSLWKEAVSYLELGLTADIQHDGRVPETSDEKAEFRKLLRSWYRKGDEENLDEALSQAYRAWSSSGVSWSALLRIATPLTPGARRCHASAPGPLGPAGFQQRMC